MEKILRQIVLYLVIPLALFGQPPSNSPQLLATSDGRGDDVLEMLDNLAISLRERLTSGDGVLAIRLCSAESLTVAVPFAFGAPHRAVRIFEKYGVERGRILFLRDDRACPRNTKGLYSTQYYLLSRGSDLPPFVEARYASVISWSDITAGNNLYRDGEIIPLDDRAFADAIQSVADDLKRDKGALAIVRVPGPGWKARGDGARNLKTMLTHLDAHGISRHRIIIKQISYGNAHLKYAEIIISRQP